MKILIVDDDQAVCGQVKTLLAELGYNAGFIMNPDFLLPRLAQETFELILMDVHMPRTDGLTLLKSLKAHAGYRDIPVIMLTGDTTEQTLVACFERGAADYLTKPISVLTLKARVFSVLTTQQHIREVERQRQQIQQSLEKAEELNQLKSRFISVASHEFRTPLTAILGSCELLQGYGDHMDQAKREKHFQRIQKSVLRMNHLLEEVLIIGKAEAGKLEFNPQPLDLEEFCRDLIDEIAILGEGKDTIKFSVQGDCAQAVMDEKLLGHLLSNLLSNAIKYSPQGASVTLDLLCRNGQAIIQVRDQGIGIPEADQKRLFETFHRASNVGTIAGTGLGLSIVKQAVDLHGGTIAVTSQVGQGTTFTVTLPMRP